MTEKHLVCANCGILLDCDWMGISLDYDDECRFGGSHCQQVIDCDCETRVKNNEGNDILSGKSVLTTVEKEGIS